MDEDITKYIREVYTLATSVNLMLDAAHTDPAIPQQMREDLEWELSRLKSNMADCVAALIAVNVREES